MRMNINGNNALHGIYQNERNIFEFQAWSTEVKILLEPRLVTAKRTTTGGGQKRKYGKV